MSDTAITKLNQHGSKLDKLEIQGLLYQRSGWSAGNGNFFFIKKDSFYIFFFNSKVCGNFLTFKWLFSGGSGRHDSTRYVYNVLLGSAETPGLNEFHPSLNQGFNPNWHPHWVRLTPNGTNLGLFKISFSTFWLGEPKCIETDL